MTTLTLFLTLLAVTLLPVLGGILTKYAAQKEKWLIALQLFERAETLLKEDRPDAAGAVLGCIPWNTHKHGEEFQKFLEKITRKKYDNLCLRIDTDLAKEKARTAEAYFAQGLLYESAQNWYEAAELLEEIDPEQARIWRGKCENAEQMDDGFIKKPSQHLSDEELARKIMYICQLTKPRDGYNREKMVNEVMDALFNKTSLKKT